MLKALFRQPGSWLWLALAVYALDYLTKVWASENLVHGWSREILPFMNWTLAHNTGAAFSMLSEAGGWQRWFFVGLALVVSIGLLIWLFRLPATARWLPVAIALLLGGAIGNLHDRILQGYVVDFIHVYYGDWHFPAFNIADCGITVGAIMLIIDSLFLEQRRERSQ